MVSNKSFICETCNYITNRKYNLELHKRSPNACEKRMKRDDKNKPPQNVTEISQNVTVAPQNVTDCDQMNFDCVKCNKNFKKKWNYQRHIKTCTGVNTLQCPNCKKFFKNRQNKNEHMKNVKCEFILSDEQQKIKDLEDQLEECGKELEEEKKKRQEAEKKSNTTINNYNITHNNYFDHSINYNNYDNLNVDHITKEDIKRLFNNCRMQYPELSEDLTRMILSPKENQCIYLPEGQKSNTCAVLKDGVEMRKPLIRVLMDLGVQTATLIRDSNVIVRNKKDVVNNQFWADNRNACGLNISDIEYMTDNDKEIVQRNKNIVLDMCDGKI